MGNANILLIATVLLTSLNAERMLTAHYDYSAGPLIPNNRIYGNKNLVGGDCNFLKGN